MKLIAFVSKELVEGVHDPREFLVLKLNDLIMSISKLPEDEWDKLRDLTEIEVLIRPGKEVEYNGKN